MAANAATDKKEGQEAGIKNKMRNYRKMSIGNEKELLIFRDFPGFMIIVYGNKGKNSFRNLYDLISQCPTNPGLNAKR